MTVSDSDMLSRPLIADSAPEDWLRAIEDCATPSSMTLVTGPSNSGKSIFTKRLINRHLTGLGRTAAPVPAVFLLDLNPLKQEYGPSGQISLVRVLQINLEPAFMHPTSSHDADGTPKFSVIRAHAIPIDMANYWTYFQHCVEDLLHTFKNLHGRDRTSPLVIDTSGVLHASDSDTLVRLLARFKVHNIVHLSNAQAIGIDGAAILHLLQTTSSQYGGTVHDITAQNPSIPLLRSEAELRAMQMQSYFHLETTTAGDDHRAQLNWAQTPISHFVPWEFCYKETPERCQDFVGFAMYSEPVEPASLVHALVGSVVKIVSSTSSVTTNSFATLPRTSRYQIPYFPPDDETGMVTPLDQRTSSLLCTAMVRDFDPVNKLVRLVVPRIHEDLLQDLVAERTVLIGGCCEIPDWAFMEGTDPSPLVASDVVASDAHDELLGWLERESSFEAAGYLHIVRRVRKFQT